MANYHEEAVELIEAVHDSVLTAGYVDDWNGDTGEICLNRGGGRDGPLEDIAIMDDVFRLLGTGGDDRRGWFPIAEILSVYKRLGLIRVEYSLGSPDKAREFMAEKERNARRSRVHAARNAVKEAEQQLRAAKAEMPEDLPDKPTEGEA